RFTLCSVSGWEQLHTIKRRAGATCLDGDGSVGGGETNVSELWRIQGGGLLKLIAMRVDVGIGRGLRACIVVGHQRGGTFTTHGHGGSLARDRAHLGTRM